MNRILAIALLTLFFAGCTGTKQVTDTLIVADTEFRQLDTMTISAPVVTDEEKYQRPDYQPTYHRKHDLVHTALDLRFDWTKQYVLGQATLDFKPYFYPMDQLVLDAKGFDIHKVAMVTGGQKRDLKYDYDNLQLSINLGRNYQPNEEYTIFIDYTAKPNELEETIPSEAIQGEKGLYFINPLNEDPDKPMQIWTQGETEYNSCWFPTIDKPNERCTQEMRLTVEDRFRTLSNGLLKSSNKNSDGTRTDYWVMDKPHAPYLFMLTIGEFAVVQDSWNGMPMEYWVEEDYKDVAADIYSNTKEMLTFFSDITGVKYPWQKYSQVIVRDFVSGAMENTTGVIFYEQIQKDARELIDNHNERIVAHELIHHWFGDLVTCESWSNLALNESFANYGEYLWMEHKYGKEEAENHRRSEIRGYMNQAKMFKHPLIFFDYEDKEDMFDAHSYNKGGAILHMLRDYVGDDAFFAGWNRYLTENEYTDVEAHELRLAFEDVTGEDMNWFFNQWFFEPGHPNLEYSHEYDELRNEVRVTIEQTQSAEDNAAVYRLPMAIDIYADTPQAVGMYDQKPTRHNITVDQRKQTFTFPVNGKPQLVNVDPDKTILCEKKQLSKTESEYVHQYYIGGFMDRREALEELSKSKSNAAKKVMRDAMNDSYWTLRNFALNAASPTDDAATLAKLAKNDKHSQVRAGALAMLGEAGDVQYISLAKNAIDNELPYACVGAGLDALAKLDKAEALSYATKLKDESNADILMAISSMYAESGDTKYMPFFEEKMMDISNFSIFGFMEGYDALMTQADPETALAAIGRLSKVSTDMSQWQWRRLVATRSIFSYRKYLESGLEVVDEADKPKLQSVIDEINKTLEMVRGQETSPRILEFYKQM